MFSTAYEYQYDYDIFKSLLFGSLNYNTPYPEVCDQNGVEEYQK